VIVLASNKLTLIFTIIIAFAVSTVLLYAFLCNHFLITTHIVTNSSTAIQNAGSEQSANKANNAITIKSHLYKLAVKALKNILKEAKNIYLNALKNNEPWKALIYEPYSGFSKTFILNASILNETTLIINHTVYKYVVVSVYESESKFNFMPRRVKVDGVLVELLPRNKSITYTGIAPCDYLVNYKGKKYRVSFASIGFVEATHYLVASTDKISNDIYKVKITVARELGSTAYVDTAWLILIRNG